MQGFNMGRYVPPDQEGVISGNAVNKKHPLGARASKLASQGILVVRFEMPFPVWCSHCPKPTIIGQGVRFNAEKKRVGSYHTSPIYSFRIKHTACGGEIEIRTDPQHTRYVVISGGKARDTGTDDDSLVKVGDDFTILTQQERADLRESAFSKLEKTIADREKLEDARQRIGDLQDVAMRQWNDPYTQNQRLRRAFRVGRHEREKQGVQTEDLRDRMSLGIDLLPETEEDARRAALIDFGSVEEKESDPDAPFSTKAIQMDKTLAKPLFDHPHPSSSSEKTSKPRHEGRNHPHRHISSLSSKKHPLALKSEITASKMRETLLSEIVGNTRAARDPFLDFDFSNTKSRDRDGSPATKLPGLLKNKRKRTVAVAGLEGQESGGSSGVNSPLPDLSPSSAASVSKKQRAGGKSTSKEGNANSASNGIGNSAITSLVAYDSDSE